MGMDSGALVFIYVALFLLGFVVSYLIMFLAVKHGTFAALFDAGLVKGDSPWSKRRAFQAD